MGSNNKKDCIPHIGVGSLLMEYQLFIDSHDMLDNIHQANNVWPDIERYCAEFESSSSLLHLITGLHSQSQIDFERALFCSWLSLILAKRLNLSAAYQKNLFYAGLFQDVGKHSLEALDTQFMTNGAATKLNGNGHAKNGDQTFHSLVISRFMEESGYLPDRVSELVLNHHAKDDGTGYPNHVGENQLDTDHQILIATNEISDYLDQKGGHNNLTRCLPWLKLCSLLYFKKVYGEVVELLKPHCHAVNDENDVERSRTRLLNQRDSIDSLRSQLLRLSAELVRDQGDIPALGLRSNIRKIMELFSDTGVLSARALDAEDPDIIKANIADVNLVYTGLPVLLDHCQKLVDHLQTDDKFEQAHPLLGEASDSLKLTISELEGQRFTVFR